MNEQISVTATTTTKILPKVPIGGDFAGLYATLDNDGKLIPVPEYLIPEVLLEWGQAPTALEVLISEENDKRYITTIYPATGCGIDNLETSKAVENIHPTITTKNDDDINDNAEFLPSSDSGSVWSALMPCTVGKQQRLRIEASFGIQPDDNDTNLYRSRIQFDLQFSQSNDKFSFYSIIKPIKVYLERQINNTSTTGTVADGGGLDGQRVAKWLGILNTGKMQSFATQQPKQIIQSSTSSNDDVLSLPGNITIACNNNKNNGSDDDEDNNNNLIVVEIGQLYPELKIRQVVQWVITTTETIIDDNENFSNNATYKTYIEEF